MEKQKNAVGRRKEAVARVYLSKGTGSITVNDKEYKAYFPMMYLQNQVELPLKTIDSLGSFDVVVNVQGGGPKGQAEAIKTGFRLVGPRFLEIINHSERPVQVICAGKPYPFDE